MGNPLDHIMETRKVSFEATGQYLPDSEILMGPTAPFKSTSTTNNGGDTDYYSIDPSWTTAQDIIEARQMNFAQGNIFKAAFTFNAGRHEATTYERELNKIAWFVNRELKRLHSTNPKDSQ